MDKASIIEILHEISRTFITVDEIDLTTQEGEKTFFSSLLSDSVQAVNFVILIEDEFEFEFDDDEIDLGFYSGYDRIVELIQKRVQNNK